MRRARNHYCTTCLQTRRFHDARDVLVCEHCHKELQKVAVST
jgi:ribosomal protein L37AE/L43A